MLEENKSNYLCAVYLSGQSGGTAFCDLSTGEFCAANYPADAVSHILNELGRFAPREAVCADAAAEKLRGKILHLDRDDVDLPEDLVFIQDILTFKVYDLRVDRVIGHIRDVLTSNPAHDMYEIAGEDGRLIYIPAIKPFLKEIDMDAGIVYVESIEGLIE